jgi:hypothetical protein
MALFLAPGKFYEVDSIGMNQYLDLYNSYNESNEKFFREIPNLNNIWIYDR